MAYNMYSPCQPCCQTSVDPCCVFPACSSVINIRDVYITDSTGTYLMVRETDGYHYLSGSNYYQLSCIDTGTAPQGIPHSRYLLSINGLNPTIGINTNGKKRIDFTFYDNSNNPYIIFITLTSDSSAPCGCVGCSGPCATVWPEVLYLTDMNGTHALSWNSGTGWTGCYTFNATSSSVLCSISSGPVMVRYGINCPTFSPCNQVGIFMDYEIKDCNFALGAYYLSNYKTCGDTVNRSWITTSTSYSTNPISATWTFPTSRLEFGTTFSPLPVYGNIVLSE